MGPHSIFARVCINSLVTATFSCQIAWRRLLRMSLNETDVLRVYQVRWIADCGASSMAGLCAPEQDQAIDIEDQGSGSLSGFGDTVLQVFQAEELFQVAEAIDAL